MKKRFLLLVALAMFSVLPGPAWASADKRIALTFDDVPRQRGAFLTPDERTARLIKALHQAKVRQAAFFVNPGRLDLPDGVGGIARIESYVSAGHVIANHSFAHRRLSEISAAAYLQDIAKTEAWLANRRGHRPWFRYPYLDEGGADKAKRDEVRRGLKALRVRNGYVTADGSDWHLETLTIEAKNAGKVIDMNALRKLYVSSQMSGVEYHDELARRTLGRSPAHVLLLHETDLAALFIEDLVAELQRHGWTIITADEAFADPIGLTEPDVPFSAGTITGAIAWENDIKPPMWPIWMSTGMVSYLFNKGVISDQPAVAPTG